MNWDAIGALGELVGAIAVVATLIYLGRQMRHASEESARNQSELSRTRYDALNRELARSAAAWGATPEITDVMFRGFAGTANLTQQEMFRFYAGLQRFFRSMESLFVYSTEGGVQGWGVENWRNGMIDFMTFPGLREYWQDRQHWYSDAFRREVDALTSDASSVMAEAYDARAKQEADGGSTGQPTG
ncbi:MAG: hypothetical protein HKN72_08325 [Gemmatimonadetes bacterium]|nr:hypothetical protein [Gemmatimonadota bacterium]